MIILDTHVVSEPMKPNPDPNVIAWLDNQLSSSLYLTTISLSELLTGVALLPEGKRKAATGLVLEHIIETLVGDRLLEFNKQAARAYADVLACTYRAGWAIGVLDAQIAAIARCYDCRVAAHDTGPFLAAGIDVVNPWNYMAS